LQLQRSGREHAHTDGSAEVERSAREVLAELRDFVGIEADDGVPDLEDDRVVLLARFHDGGCAGADRPIVAARCSKPFTVSRARPVAGGWEFGWISVSGGPGAVIGDTIEVFVFDRPPERSGPGFGLQVFGPDGRVVFDSQNRYMKVVDARTLEGATPTANVNLGPGNYAQIVTVPGFRWTGVQASPTADWQWACFAGVVTSNANGYTVAQGTTGEGTYAFFGMPAPRAESARMHIMTVDVTGY